MQEKNRPITIGIGGVSRSGKTTLAIAIKDHFENMGLKVEILSQDSFTIATDLIPRINDQIDWEDPISIDFPRLISSAKQAKKNHSVVIVEGLFAFYDPELKRLYDKKIYVQIEKDLFLKRKAEDTRWGYIPLWFFDHIWDSFLKYGKIDENIEGYLYMNGSENIDFEVLIAFLEENGSVTK